MKEENDIGDVAFMPETMIYSEAYQNLNINGLRILPVALIESNKNILFNLPYKIFLKPPFNMYNTSIVRGLDDLLSHGFLEYVSIGYPGNKALFKLSEKWEMWKPGDIIFSREGANKNVDAKGHVYVIKKENGFVKIGVSVNPKIRISGIETTSGEKFSVSWISEQCDNFFEIEQSAHKEFGEYRGVGEWFNIDFNKAVDYCKQYAS